MAKRSNQTAMKGSPDRHHGGQEPPDDVQDRPEQNAGYDAAVRGDRGSRSTVADDTPIDPLTDDEGDIHDER